MANQVRIIDVAPDPELEEPRDIIREVSVPQIIRTRKGTVKRILKTVLLAVMVILSLIAIAAIINEGPREELLKLLR